MRNIKNVYQCDHCTHVFINFIKIMSHCFIAFQRKDPCYRNKNNTYLHQMKLQMTKKEKSITYAKEFPLLKI